MEDTFSGIMVKFWEEGDFLILRTMALADFRFSSLIRIYRPPKFRPKMLFSDWLDRFRSFFAKVLVFGRWFRIWKKICENPTKKPNFGIFVFFRLFGNSYPKWVMWSKYAPHFSIFSPMEKKYFPPLIHVTCNFSIYKYTTKIGETLPTTAKITFSPIDFKLWHHMWFLTLSNVAYPDFRFSSSSLG